MRNKSTAARLIKRKSEKCISGVVRSFSKLQDKFAQMLDEDESVLEYRVNVDKGNVPHFDYLYTTDFVVKRNEGIRITKSVIAKELKIRDTSLRKLPGLKMLIKLAKNNA